MAGSATVINGGAKGINNECQLMERCDGHGGGVRGWRGVMVIREVFGGMEDETVERKSSEICEKY